MTPTPFPTPRISVVIPAYQEGDRIGETVTTVSASLRERFPDRWEILVVDDGSSDETATRAAKAGAQVLRLDRNRGKGTALETGLNTVAGDVLLMLDADLRQSAGEAILLLEPILQDQADMTVAVFPRVAGHKGGFGSVVRLARWGLQRAGGPIMRAPLSGQRAMRREMWSRIGRLDPGFGLEMGLNLDAARLGLRVLEVQTQMAHRVTGRNWAGFRHRGRQFLAVLQAILRRWPLRPTSSR